MNENPASRPRAAGTPPSASRAGERRDARRARLRKVLRDAGIVPTAQRLAVAVELLSARVHLSAEDVVRRVARGGQRVSRATVYNTLRKFVEHGLARQVFVAPERVIYDSNPHPHHHFLDSRTGELVDIEPGPIEVHGLPDPPPGKTLEHVELVVRLKSAE